MGNRILKRCSILNHRNVRTGCHDLPCSCIIKPEDRVYHLFLILFNRTFHLTYINPLANFLLSYSGNIGSTIFTSTPETVIHPEKWGKQESQIIDRRCNKQCDRLGLPCCKGLRTDFTED